MMNRMLRRRTVQLRILALIVLALLPWAAQPLAAASPTSELDLEAIDAFISQQQQRHGIPGLALGIVEGDQIVHLQGFGNADEQGRAITAQTPFLLASVSKPLTAFAIMQLVEAGKVDLDAPVQRYVPEFRLADPVASQAITVRHLLLHTSGIPATSCDTRIDAVTLAQFVAELETVELSAPPGLRHDYCSGNYNVLGRLIEKVSGLSFADYMQHNLFAPLEMRHSFTAEQPARQAGMAQGYQWLFGLVAPTHYRYNPSQLPSGFLISSAEDMSHFLIAQLNGGRFGATALLSPAAIAAMQTAGVEVEPGQRSYGLGWQIGALGEVPAVYHYGDNFNVHALLLLEPQSRRGAILLMNANNVLGVATAFREIEGGLARLLAGEQPAPATSWSLPALYLMVDLPLALLLAAALWPLFNLRKWVRRQQQRQEQGQLRRVRVALRIAGEIALPLLLLAAVRLALHRMGAQSWLEGLSLLPDLGLWLWSVALLVLATGTMHLLLFLRLRLRMNPQQAAWPFSAGTKERSNQSVANNL